MSTVGIYEKNDGVGPSGIIWNKFPRDVFEDHVNNYAIYDDFLQGGANNVAGVANLGPYNWYSDTGAIAGGYNAAGGGIEITGNNLDNDATNLRTSATPFKIISTSPMFAFECRVKKASIADEALSFFIGMNDNAIAADNSTLTDDTGAVIDRNLVGFHCAAEAAKGGEILDFIWKADGQTQKTLIASVQTLVADTYYKLGFVHDPNWPADKRLRVYIDGVEQTTYGTAALIAASAGAASDFPSDVQLGAEWATKVGASAESKTQLQWWAFAQAKA